MKVSSSTTNAVAEKQLNAVNRYAVLKVIKSKMIKPGTPEDHLPKNLNVLPGQVEFAYFRSYEK